MVLKRSKHGLNTGNTLRAAKLKQSYHDLCANATISQKVWFRGDDIERQNVAASVAERNLPLAFYPFDYTSFSVNKHGRWEMVEELQNLVEDLKSNSIKNVSQWFPDIELTVSDQTEMAVEKSWNFFVEDAVKSPNDPIIWNQHSRGVQRKQFLPHGEKNYKISKTFKQQKISKRSIRKDFENAEDQESCATSNRSALQIEYSYAQPSPFSSFRVKDKDLELLKDDDIKREFEYTTSKGKGQKVRNRQYWKGLYINEERHPEDYAVEFMFRQKKKKKKKIEPQESDPEKLGFTGPYSKTKRVKNKEKITENDTTIKSAKDNQNYTTRSKGKKKREKEGTFSKSQESKVEEKVSLWSFIEVLLQQKNENKKLQIVDCKGNSCSLSNENRKDTDLEQSKQPLPPQGKKPEKLRQRKVKQIQGKIKDTNKGENSSRKEGPKQNDLIQEQSQVNNAIDKKRNFSKIEQMEQDNVANNYSEKTTFEKAVAEKNQENSTKIKSKKKRKTKQKAKDLQNLSDLSRQDDKIISSGILNIPLEIKVKSLTLDVDYLSKKFGKIYKECKAGPRCFCIDITQDVENAYEVVARDSAFLAIVMFQCSNLHYESHQTVAIDNQTVEQIRLKLLVDLEPACQEALVLSLMKTLQTYLIYPVQKLLEIVINVFKSLFSTGLQQLCVEEPHCLPVSPEKRTNYDWLNALCSWQYDIYTAPEARNIFNKEESSNKKLAEFGTSTDPVTCLSEMSLKEYKCHLLALQDTKIQHHPQWQKCPNKSCKRVVKLCAPGLLDYFVCIECLCGKAWCFSCQNETHWPASCSQARKYRDLQEKKGFIPDYYIKKEVCTLCMNQSKMTTQTSVSEPASACQCLFTLCVSCFNSSDSLSEIKPKLEQVVSIGDDESLSLLPSLFQKNAVFHCVQRLAWNQTERNIAAVTFTRQIQKSKIRPATMLPSIGRPGYLRRAASKLSCLGPIQAGGTPPESGKILQPVPPSIGSPRIQSKRSNDMGALFIVVVQNFIYHSHYLLEFVSVVLSQTVFGPEASTIAKMMCKLESIVEDIDKILQQTKQSPTVLLHLKRQIEEGNKVTADIVSRVRHLYSTK